MVDIQKYMQSDLSLSLKYIKEYPSSMNVKYEWSFMDQEWHLEPKNSECFFFVKGKNGKEAAQKTYGHFKTLEEAVAFDCTALLDFGSTSDNGEIIRAENLF